MSFLSILETLFIGPLKLIFEIIFFFSNRLIGHPGLAIICLSLIMNILVLPLYRRADAMQEASRDIEAKLSKGVSHIKKTFSGDERMMILQTYYRQNNYKPTNALNGSVSLLLEIPFFMAAYQFLSHLTVLDGVSLGPIKDLGAPDGLIVIGSLTLNALPIIMTLVNIISSALYLKGFPLKTKIQLYAMALFFLVFLYTSPSCLVFYWTLNNVFSLVKTIFYKLKNPKKVLNILCSVVGLAILGFTLFIYNSDSVLKRAFLIAVAILLQLPLTIALLKNKIHFNFKESTVTPNRKLFILGSLFLTALIGLLIPSTFIAASPQEYIDISYYLNPLWYVVSSLCMAAGTFLIWMGVFYWLASPKGKVIFERIVWILSGVMLVNYMFFGTKLGNLSSMLQYDNGVSFAKTEILVNILVIIAIAVVLYFCISKFKRVVATVLVISIIALSGMSALNVVTINKSINSLSYENNSATFQLSKTGKNVVVIMLDRAIGGYIPYIFNENPELKEKFAGFTHYSNTISFGGSTNFGVPALLGGYEYTPVEMNKRADEKLVNKHNEALKVMPTIFADNGYKVTMCDPTYANYQWIPDLSVFDDNPNINAYITKGNFNDINQRISAVESKHRNFFCFSFMKSMPLFIQPAIYNGGLYNQVVSESTTEVYSNQTVYSTTKASGFNASFMDAYNVLNNMHNISRITDEEVNTFMFLSSDVTHNPMLLQMPDYVPIRSVDNSAYYDSDKYTITSDNKDLAVQTTEQAIHYHANMAALIQLGNWFDFMRENGVYDNTKIILVSDHGRTLNHIDELMTIDERGKSIDMTMYNPLLMVKDFGSTEFTTNTEFMTNADVPVLAMKDLINNPTNPFTGKAINSNEKTAHDQYVIISGDWDVAKNNGNTFFPARWASVTNNLWDKEDWEFYNGTFVLDEHKAP